MENGKIIAEGITFDDVLLIPAKSELVPSQAETSTQLTDNIRINIPIISAAMDTVTEAALAIALAQEWRIRVILVHRSNGSMYLRPEYHGKRFREMVC